jgi:RHS repeat-associated protein
MYVAQEHSIYGSSRVGVDNRKDTLYKAGSYSPAWGGVGTSRRDLGSKSFELANHLGNVLVTVSDKPVYNVSSGTIYFQPETTSISDYYPFGAPINGRGYASEIYRFGYNTQEKDDEISGEGNSQAFTFRIYDPRAGRFLSVDPIGKNYPHSSFYAFAENSPIQCIDLEGLEKYKVTGRSFIPMATIPNPPYSANFTSESFEGDNRMSYKLNTPAYRTEQKVNVDFDSKSVIIENNTAKGSRGLNKAGIVVESSAPSINYQFDVTITPSADRKTFDYQIKGAADGFPAYEMWITDETNNKSYLLFNRTPKSKEEGPGSLFPPMEHKYDLKGNSIFKTPKTEVPFLGTQNSPES